MRLRTGSVVYLDGSVPPSPTAPSAWRVTCDALWYLLLLAVVIPFLMCMLLLGCAWSLLCEVAGIVSSRTSVESKDFDDVDYRAYLQAVANMPIDVSVEPPPWNELSL